MLLVLAPARQPVLAPATLQLPAPRKLSQAVSARDIAGELARGTTAGKGSKQRQATHSVGNHDM